MPRPLSTPGKDLVPIVQEAGWDPGLVRTGAKNLAPPGFDPRTVQPVASRYTDWATRPTQLIIQSIYYKVCSCIYRTCRKTWYPSYSRLGGTQVQKISPQPGFDPQTIQPVASHYTDWATWPMDHTFNTFHLRSIYTPLPLTPAVRTEYWNSAISVRF
jgi:hypothetical protein